MAARGLDGAVAALWRVHDRRVARASAQRRARPMVVLSGRLLGASEWAAAGAGGAGSRDGADRQAGAIISWRAGGRRLPAVDGGHRCCCRSAAKERRPSRRVGRATLAAVATVRTPGGCGETCGHCKRTHTFVSVCIIRSSIVYAKMCVNTVSDSLTVRNSRAH